MTRIDQMQFSSFEFNLLFKYQLRMLVRKLLHIKETIRFILHFHIRF